MSEDYEKQEKLLVLVHGSGVVRAGQWARRFVGCLQRIIDNQTIELETQDSTTNAVQPCNFILRPYMHRNFA